MDEQSPIVGVVPKREGIQQFGITSRDHATGDRASIVPTPRHLRDLMPEYVLFTYAPLFLHGDLTFNPVQAHLNEVKLPRVVSLLRTSGSLFNNIVEPWDSLLMVCPHEYWESLNVYLGTLGLVNRMQRRFTRVVCQVFDAKDDDGLVTIHAFGADTNHGYTLFQPSETPLIELPSLVRLPSLPATVALADALLAQDTSASKMVDALELRQQPVN